MPTCGKSVSPSNGRLSPRPGRWRQRASRAFRTNQPSPAATSPCSVRSKGASGTTGGSYKREPDAAGVSLVPERKPVAPRLAAPDQEAVVVAGDHVAVPVLVRVVDDPGRSVERVHERGERRLERHRPVRLEPEPRRVERSLRV